MADKIFPFLWHHGESNEVILKEIEKICECGIRAFCVESRPHPDFCGERWWKDLGFILSEAQKRNMRVWILDDVHYPSGRANGEIERRKDLQQTNVILTYMDVCGPLNSGKILLTDYGKEEGLVGVFAFLVNGREFVYETGIDLTENVHNDILYWDVPEGHYRVFAVYKTKKAAAWNFVDVLNPQSTALMIEQIYEPHFNHFKDYFGNTLVGFFSDEPRFGNGASNEWIVRRHWKDRGLGVIGMAYPWNDALLSDLNIKDKRVLIALWHDLLDRDCAEFRVRYMNYITEKFAENFSGMLGEWCEEHGVMYSGHIIEDEGAHTRTCCSAGHYFRSTRNQSIAGIDVVYNQIDVDFINDTHAIRGCPYLTNDVFYNFALAKLASSAAHLDNRKKNRALCEIFGSFGWGESIAKMKMLVDFMLVRGINHFIPHAFNPFIEDTDSPPFFYCGGTNPQYDSFKTLSEYMLKACELFNGGDTDIRVAVLYHADAEWSGYKYMPMETVCKYLTQRQIDFDIIPEYEVREINDEMIITDNCRYKYLIIPYREYFENSFKEKLESNRALWTMVHDVSELDDLDKSDWSSYSLENPDKDIRVYKYIKTGKAYYFVTNESKRNAVNLLLIEEHGYYVCNDIQSGLCESGKITDGLPVRLSGGQSVLFEVSQTEKPEKHYFFGEKITIAPTWRIYTSDSPFNKWKFYDETEDLYDIAGWEHIPDFCGKIKYECTFNVKGVENVLLDLGVSTCGLRVKLNGFDLGERIAVPYAFDVSDKLRAGENTLEIVVTTTLGLKKKDIDTHFSAIGKYALPENPVLRFYKA